jgi:hypothetical protein
MRAALYRCSGALLALAGLLFCASAHADEASARFAPDWFLVQLGRASDTTAASVGVGWDWRWQKRWGERGIVSGYHEVSIGHWRADTGGSRAVVTQLGVTPTLRYWPDGQPRRWFIEAGVGANVLAPIYRTRDKRFSTAFNFGDHIGVGYRTAGAGGEWSLRLQHFSNAGINHPNPGENFVQLRWSAPLGAAGLGGRSVPSFEALQR